MSVEAVIHRLICDGCHRAWISPVADTVDQAREQVALNGWAPAVDPITGVTLDQCPACVWRAKRDSMARHPSGTAT